MKLLLTGAIQWPQERIDILKSLGHQVLYIQDERIPLSQQGIDVTSIEGVVCNGLFLYNDISEFQNLSYIQLTSAGYDRVPLDYIKEHHIELFNAKGVYSIPMAEFAVLGVLQLYKQAKFFFKNQQNKVWEKCRDIIELYGKKVAVVGCGNVGQECAKRFKAFGCQTIGVDLYPYESRDFDDMFGLDKLDTVLPDCDIVVLTLPLTDATKHLFDEARLRLLKSDAVLVNISRGAVINTEALIRMLPNIGGAVLDVFENEPLKQESLLWNFENVIITPHNSFVGEGNSERLWNIILRNLK